MRRTLALLVLISTSWSYVAALECEMGAEGSTSGAEAAVAIGAHDADRTHAGHHGSSDAHPQDPSPTPEHSHRDGSGERCLMVMTCGLFTSTQSGPSAIRQMPTDAKRVVAASTPRPDMPVTAIDPPPPRRSV